MAEMPDWLKALSSQDQASWMPVLPASQVPVPQMYGSDPGPSALQRFLQGMGKALPVDFTRSAMQTPDPATASVAMNMLRTLTQKMQSLGSSVGALAGSVPGAFSKPEDAWRASLPGAPAPSPAPAAAAPTAAPGMPAPITIPRVPTRAPVGPGGSQTMDFPFNAGPMPPPPVLPQPQQVAGPAPPNFGAFDKFMAQTKPGSSDAFANVFSQAAKGAASVPATEAGSFARALAAAGSGAAAGLGQSGAQLRDYNKDRAGGELSKAQLIEKQREHAATVAVHNAQLQYNRDILQAQMQHQYDTAARQEQLPKVQHDGNGITVSTVNPTDKKVNVQFYPTKNVLDQADKMKNIFEAFGSPTQAAEAAEAQFIMNTYKDNPTLANGSLQQLAVRRVISNGAGAQVFGKAYETSVKTVTKQLQQENPTLSAKPEVYQSVLNDRLTSSVLAHPGMSTSTDWLKRAAPHSATARILLGTGTAAPAEDTSGGQQ